jgi:hypothetical protein
MHARSSRWLLLAAALVLVPATAGRGRADGLIDELREMYDGQGGPEAAPLEEGGPTEETAAEERDAAPDPDAPIDVNAPPERETREEVDLPEGWEPVADEPPPARTGADGPAGRPAPRPRQPRGPQPVVVADAPLAPASAFLVQTPWGELPFAEQGAYHREEIHGPGFTIKAPEGWRHSESKHPVIPGMQHRFTAPDGLTRVVVVVFPMTDEPNLAEYITGKQVQLLSSFKFRRARRISLARRTGVGVAYRGILFMRDAMCHLFLTDYMDKGYLVYGIYFDREGGESVGAVMHSLKVFRF